ncbi:hypothetical protein Moror_10817 [Moniliophthora roreri MCA 2997]|uniref:BTB domain-containing protein n=2 Tax=Moniliophthora roreri TaxID=221103 RepID=V2X2G1_MONRO|nr:hypothetical protein Moror_10817 [Moniliophthora roreri MCA 2997]KAI3621298.1 hypothetical protein WG66_014354 [Moniliophthora roreri]
MADSMKPRFIIFNDNTIIEPAYASEARSRKRKRVDDVGESELRRSNRYYDERCPEACVLCVEKMLYRVEATLLRRASEREDLVGGSDENPIILNNVEAGDFEELLWALKASPAELEAPFEDKTQVRRLISIASASCALQCTSLRKLAISRLRDVSSNEVLVDTDGLVLLVELAIKHWEIDLLNTVENVWMNRIRSSSSSSPLVIAILTTDRYHMRLPRLAGAAYYAYLQELTTRHTSVSKYGATQIDMDPMLGPVQRARLLAGYWSLNSFWERLRRTPPWSVQCGHRDRCRSVWACRWHTSVVSLRVLSFCQTDVLGILSVVSDLLGADTGLGEGMFPMCRESALGHLQTIQCDLERDAVYHFAGV